MDVSLDDPLCRVAFEYFVDGSGSIVHGGRGVSALGFVDEGKRRLGGETVGLGRCVLDDDDDFIARFDDEVLEEICLLRVPLEPGERFLNELAVFGNMASLPCSGLQDIVAAVEAVDTDPDAATVLVWRWALPSRASPLRVWWVRLWDSPRCRNIFKFVAASERSINSAGPYPACHRTTPVVLKSQPGFGRDDGFRSVDISLNEVELRGDECEWSRH